MLVEIKGMALRRSRILEEASAVIGDQLFINEDPDRRKIKGRKRKLTCAGMEAASAQVGLNFTHRSVRLARPRHLLETRRREKHTEGCRPAPTALTPLSFNPTTPISPLPPTPFL